MISGTPGWFPSSTYRLQLGPALSFGAVRRAVPYLARLGVGGLYLSPMLKPRPGSTHGYDICDHTAVNPELGTSDDLEALARDADRQGMGIVADIVPNHVGVDPAVNLWWREVLENGPCSSYAEYFDIDWEPVTAHLHQKVLLPILGDQYGAVLERGELRLSFADGQLWLHYFDHTLPVNPRQSPVVLTLAVPYLETLSGSDAPELVEFLSILTGLAHLPPYTDTSAESIAMREREKGVLRQRLVRLVEEAPRVAEAIHLALTVSNGVPGSPDSFDTLHTLLEAQPYRLASWRTAMDEINYRRFFDINDLAGVRVEEERVFQATHALIAEWIAAGWVTGLRVDHPDGLFDPAGYFARLQQLARASRGGDAPFYVVAEKILSPGEDLRPDWQVAGTTGYTLLNDVNGVFVDALSRIARAHRHTRDFTQNSLRDLITEYVASFPVYRTYVNASGWTPADEALIDQTMATARRRNPAMEGTLFTFLRAVLLPEPLAEGPATDPGHAPQTEADRLKRLSFSMKLQQYTGPVQAKALEDTSFYRYNVLVSTNEVGSEPAHAVRTIDQVHAANLARQRGWPYEMTTLATHDTKLGEDVRARINVLSEVPGAWREAFGRVTRAAAGARTLVDGAWVPDRNDEYRFYQVLLGVWPSSLPPEATSMSAAFVERLQQYMLKAIREAKRHTSWLTPNDRYEQATLDYVSEALAGRPSRRVLAALTPLAARVMRHGVVNSLSQTTMTLAAPGVPDTFQGTEAWSFVLVDPDNRHPVDFDALSRTLEATEALRADGAVIDEAAGVALLDAWQDARVKMLVRSRLLHARRAAPELWVNGDYAPLRVACEVDASAIGWLRTSGSQAAIAVAAIRAARLGPHQWPVGAAWGPSRLMLPAAFRAPKVHDIFTGAVHPVIETDSERWVFLSQAFAALPVSVLMPDA